MRSRSVGMKVAEGLVILVAAFIIWVIIDAVGNGIISVRKHAQRKACMNNLRQFAVAEACFVHESGELVPLPTDYYKEVFKLSPTMYDCPAQKGVGTAEAPEYGFNAHLCNVTYAGKDADQRDRWEFTRVSLGEINHPEAVELVTEVARPFKWDAKTYPEEFAPFADARFQGKYVIVAAGKDAARPHQGGGIYAYLDGHVDYRRPGSMTANAGFSRYNMVENRRIDIDFSQFTDEKSARAAVARWFTVGKEGHWKNGAWVHPCTPLGNTLCTIGIRTPETGINIWVDCAATGTLSIARTGSPRSELLRLTLAKKDAPGEIVFGRPTGKTAGDSASSTLTKPDSGKRMSTTSTRFRAWVCAGAPPADAKFSKKRSSRAAVTVYEAYATPFNAGFFGMGERSAFSGVYTVTRTVATGALSLRCEGPATSTVTFHRIIISW